MSQQQKQNYRDEQEFLKAKKRTVEQVEVNARYQKANYEVMYYTLESEKLKDDYNALLERQKEERAELEALNKKLLEDSQKEKTSDVPQESGGEDVQ